MASASQWCDCSEALLMGLLLLPCKGLDGASIGVRGAWWDTRYKDRGVHAFISLARRAEHHRHHRKDAVIS